MKTLGIKDRITMISWERKVIGKNHHLDNVEEMADHMLELVKSFKVLFLELFQKGLPSFWDEDGKSISQYECFIG